jgi:predicted RNA binding protein YcfA (HicA-like mRNA interferase family)
LTRLPSLSSKELISALRRAGAKDAPRKGKGSHKALVCIDEEDKVRLIIVPHPVKDVPKGTLRSILAQAGLSAEDLKKFL